MRPSIILWPIMLACFSLQYGVTIRRVNSSFVKDYFESKNVVFLCYLGCSTQYENKELSRQFIIKGIRVSTLRINKSTYNKLEVSLRQWTVPVGVLLDGTCDRAEGILEEASTESLFDAMHMWLILENPVVQNSTTKIRMRDILQKLNLSVDADVVIASEEGNRFLLTDVFNFGKIQGNNLETKNIGEWNSERGLSVSVNCFKYYDRWDFNNLTLRAITVILDRPKVFKPEMLADPGYTPGVSVQLYYCWKVDRFASKELNIGSNQCPVLGRAGHFLHMRQDLHTVAGLGGRFFPTCYNTTNEILLPHFGQGCRGLREPLLNPPLPGRVVVDHSRLRRFHLHTSRHRCTGTERRAGAVCRVQRVCYHLPASL